MFKIEKDKQWLIVYYDDKEYRFNLDNGDMYSKNRRVKNFPACLTNKLFDEKRKNARISNKNLILLLETIKSRVKKQHLINDSYYCDYSFIEFLYSCRPNDFKVLSPSCLARYAYLGTILKCNKQLIKFFSKQPTLHLLSTMIFDFYEKGNDLQSFYRRFPITFEVLITRCPYQYEREKMLSSCYTPIFEYYFKKGELATNIVEYLQNCEFLGYTPRKSSNPRREFSEIAAARKAFQAAHEEEIFRDVYKKHREAWDFEYNDYIIKIPKRSADFIQEGLKMHHCVAEYCDSVMKEKCYIVFIRKKDNPYKPYLTGQVNPNGKIGQWYLAYDRCITKSEDIEFKQAYQEYLKEVWKM